MEHCAKHDLTYAPGGACWNCEENNMTPEEKEAAYSDPQFLRMRGGEGKQSMTLSNLTPAQMQKLQVMLSEPVLPAAPGKTAALSSERKVFARA